MLERAMGVLSIGVVDDAVLDVPWEVTRELLTTMNVSVVVTGKVSDFTDSTDSGSAKQPRTAKHDVARVLGLLTTVDSKSSLTVKALRRRFLERREHISSRNNTLLQKELSYVERKSFVPEA